MIMSKVLPDNGYLIGLNGEIVPGDEESEYIERYLPVFLLYDTVRLAAKYLLDISDNDKKDKEPVETQQDWGDLMIGLAADGRLFGLDVQLLFDIGVSIFNIILLVFLIGVPIILIIFAIKYFKQKNNYYKIKTEFYKNHMNDRQD